MAVTLTVAEFIADARIGATAEELALATRRLAYAAEAVVKYAPAAPDIIHNESCSRLASYLYDAPTVAGGAAFANSLRNSGATAILLPYRIHGLGSAEAVAEANEAIGSTGNPVTDVAIIGGQLVITYADGTTENLTLPAGGDTDTVARASANAAQSTADTNTGLITALNTEVDGLGTTRLQTNDIQAGDGIAVRVIDDPTNGPGVRITNTMVPAGPSVLTGWRFRYGTTPSAGQVAYEGAAGVAQVDNWRFGASGGFEDARAPLLALRSGDTILIRVNASRHQTITLTATPTLAGVRVLVMGTADRGRSAELPLNNGSVTITLTPAPSGGGDGTDQTARNAAASAQTTADGAQTEIDSHELATHNTDSTARTAAAAAQAEIDNHEASTHNTDGTARTAAGAAQTTANTARTELTTHEGTPHGGGGTTDQTARDAAAAAQSELDDHEASTHNTDTAARDAAAAAQTAADGKIDADAATALITAHTLQHDAHHTPPHIGIGGGVVNIINGRLPGPPVSMRFGWNQSQTHTQAVFTRANDHPIDGAAVGMSDGLALPPFPPSLDTDATLFLHLWVEGTPDVAAIRSNADTNPAEITAMFPDALSALLTVDGVAGTVYVSNVRLASMAGTVYDVLIAGATIATTEDVTNPTRYAATFGLLTDLAAGTWANYTSGLDAGEIFKHGAFAVATAAGRDKLMVPADGVYAIKALVVGIIDVGASTDRAWLETRLVRTRNPDGNPLLGRGIWSVRPIRAG